MLYLVSVVSQEDTGLVLISYTFGDYFSIIILTEDEGTFQKMARDHKGPFHFQTFIVKGMSVLWQSHMIRGMYHVGIRIFF